VIHFVIGFFLSGDALRGGDERAAHLLRNPLHSAGAYANFAGNFVDAFTCSQLLLDALFNPLVYEAITTSNERRCASLSI
jgi:hypothetical protein